MCKSCSMSSLFNAIKLTDSASRVLQNFYLVEKSATCPTSCINNYRAIQTSHNGRIVTRGRRNVGTGYCLLYRYYNERVVDRGRVARSVAGSRLTGYVCHECRQKLTKFVSINQPIVKCLRSPNVVNMNRLCVWRRRDKSRTTVLSCISNRGYSDLSVTILSSQLY